ncbi:hypothetical protein SD71_20625 [Cohnella kolymensis]|uniref:Major facilitator superfamily (MFS) profile domain-containing protein n=1 Tax=Cohnella kolymensis TaxID=1590652 RepID=A0ABR5A019_9BACL|nr:MFS transporter [Cohnella kolymensis]KIL34421.1 hypothetical protein SD71_20625 [Cohnella kolymensis]
MGTYKKYLILFSLAFGSASAYAVPYIKFIFYDALKTGLHATNEQIGLLLTFYALVHMVLFIPGGWMADRFSTRWILIVSFIATGVLNIWFAFTMVYSTSIIIWLLLGVSTGFAYWAATVKAIRLTGSKDEQGKMYGFFESFIGLVGTLLSFAALALFAHFDSTTTGLKTIVILYAISSFVAAALVYALFRENQAGEEQAQLAKVTGNQLAAMFRMPRIWLISAIIFAGYGLYIGQTYLTPYLSDVLGLTATASGLIAVLRTNFMRLVSAPIGGMISDKIGSASKVLNFCFLFTAVLLLAFFLSGSMNLFLVTAIFLLTAAAAYTTIGIMWATVEEAGIPRHVAGTAVGIASVFGYLPDTFVHALFGIWLDRFGSAGYDRIFLFLIGLCMLGSISSYYLQSLKVSKEKEVAVAQS